MCYSYRVAPAPAIDGASPFMSARQVVLLTPPRSSHPIELLSRQHPVPVTPLVATLTQPPSKCCKQTTYAIPNPFRCNTYEKAGVGAMVYPASLLRGEASTMPTPAEPKESRRDGATFSTNVLVHPYLAKLNRFCTRSPIVPWAPPGYTLSSTRRTSLDWLRTPHHPALFHAAAAYRSLDYGSGGW